MFDFHENESFEKFLNRLLVDEVRSVYAKLAHLDFINEKIVELIFKLNIPFLSEVCEKEIKFLGAKPRAKMEDPSVHRFNYAPPPPLPPSLPLRPKQSTKKDKNVRLNGRHVLWFGSECKRPNALQVTCSPLCLLRSQQIHDLMNRKEILI